MSSFKVAALLACYLTLPTLSKAAPQEAPWASVTTSADLSAPTICGDIIDYVNQNYTVFDAESAYQCLSTVPFNAAVANRFLDYYNGTLQFQSTLAYLRNPPSTYQQPAVDVMEALTEMRQNVSAGYYANQYAFEATLQSVVTAMHDAHVQLSAGILAAFSFGGYYELMSLSVDGKQLPQIYIKDDIIESTTQGWTPSPIVSINGEGIVEHLTRTAQLNSQGLLEFHADWNSLMYSPLQDIQGIVSTYGYGLTYYPGEDWNVTFANGTSNDDGVFLSFYNNPDPTGPLTTGGDFYNYFVLGLFPASFNDTSDYSDYYDDTSAQNNTEINPFGWYNTTPAFPSNPDIVQPGLSVAGGGFLTGYFLNDTKTAVLSIPSFDEYSDVIETFSQTVTEFIQRAKAAGLTRVVIDVQSNFGGQTALAIDTFRQFFPNILQFVGSNRRTFDTGNVVGNAFTSWWSNLAPGSDQYDGYYAYYSADEFVITDRLNAATGMNFTSWPQYAGPLSSYGNNVFSLIEQYNLSSPLFAQAALNGFQPSNLTYDPSAPSNTSPPWDASNIVLLTDGICSSSCSVFLEMMTQQANVRTVVVGGSPKTGPMQAASGTRGARSYDSYALDDHFNFLPTINETAYNLVPQNRNDTGIYTNYMGINLRNQIRKGESEPLQFKYLAANCRIYFTLANAYNLTRLWRDAATAIWNDTSLCVAGSTGYASTGNQTAANTPPTANTPYSSRPGSSLIKGAPQNHVPLDGLPDRGGPRNSGLVTQCVTGSNCPFACKIIPCSSGSGSASVCPATCTEDQIGLPCGVGSTCQYVNTQESKQYSNTGGTKLPGRSRSLALCYPTVGTPSLGCSR